MTRGGIADRQEDDPFLSVKESSVFSSLRSRKLNEEIRAGRLRAYRVGGKTLIRRSDLISYIEQHEITVEKSRINKSALSEALDKCVQQAKANIEHKEGR